MSDNEVKPQEIIIVRRGGGDELTAGKGGSWKIAYADFVTAMMAFFLVMWLINSANEATRAKVASYFNPIKMTDTAPAGRGLKDSPPSKNTKSESSETKSVEDVQGDNPEMAKAGPDEKSEAEMLARPDAVLAELEKEAEAAGPPSEGQAFSDPFDPKAWESLENPTQVPAPHDGAAAPPEEAAEKAAKAEELGLRPTQDSSASASGPAVNGSDEGLEKIRSELAGTVESALERANLALSVERTGEGVLVRLSDRNRTGMFNVGSAKPRPEVVSLVAGIAQVLAKLEGKVVIRGHTDTRPYSGGLGDNWLLSANRAQMSRHMLIRGGLPEDRIARIEGHGPSEPLTPDDPLADVNRRVEFLLIEPESKP